MNNWLLFVHILAAMVWLGGGLTLLIVGLRAGASSRPEAIAEFAGAVPYVGLRVLMPSVVLLLVTGVWQVLASSAFDALRGRLGADALVLFAIAFLVGAVYMSRVGIALARAGANAATNRASASAALNRWLAGYVVVLIVLLLAVWDMIFKPGL